VGGNNPDNLITLCKTCHEKVSQKKIKLNISPIKGFKAETFMSTIRWKLVNRLRELGNNVSYTYGYITKDKRIALGLPKSHVNDAFVIAGGNTSQERLGVEYIIQQVRKCNRKLFKRARSHIRNTAPRLIRGFQRFDKVLWRGVECFVFGRRSSGYFNLRKLDGTKVHASARAEDLQLLERAGTLLMEVKGQFLPTLSDGVSLSS
jgi:N6-L-threonylcarbamoyladenine synthase